jgi:hypothetical protein
MIRTSDVRVGTEGGMRLTIGALVLIGLSVAGCKGPSSHVKDMAPALLAPGWAKVDSLDQAVSIASAPQWGKGMSDQTNTQDFVAQMGGEIPASALAQVQKKNDEQYATDIAEQEKKTGMIISVVDMGSRQTFGEQRTRYTVFRKEKGAGVTLDQAAKDAKDDIMGEGEPQKVNVSIGPAIRYDSSVVQRDGGTVTRIMYVLVDGPNMYEVMFTTESAATTISTIAEPVMQTLRIKPSKDK